MATVPHESGSASFSSWVLPYLFTAPGNLLEFEIVTGKNGNLLEFS